MGEDLGNVGHRPNKLETANINLRKKIEKHDRYMRDKIFPTINISLKYHIIAGEINKRGIETRLGKEWVNVSVKRLLDRIKKLKD